MQTLSRSRRRALALILLTGLAPLTAVAGEVFKLGHMFARGSLPDQAALKFAELVAAHSKQAIRIEVYPDGVLGDERENVAQLRKGSLDFTISGDVLISSIGNQFRVVNMPFIYRDPAHALAVYDGPLGVAIRSGIRQEGIEVLAWHYVGTRMLTANRPLRTVEDLKGLKLRLPQDQAWVATWQVLGASTQQIPFTELADALRTGRIDAQENPPNFIRGQQLYKHQKYLMTTDHLPQRQMILASGQRWSRLSARQRDLLLEAVRAAARWTTTRATAQQQADLDWLLGEGGMTRIEFDMRGVRAALGEIPGRLAGTEGERLFEQILATGR
ncbi:MAG: TRAP transporter substrate-binding protein [Rhodocyclaceae bacterium]|nr:TRAP transporter substrate-binding protein [Rhodocyclaceae bacterium]